MKFPQDICNFLLDLHNTEFGAQNCLKASLGQYTYRQGEFLVAQQLYMSSWAFQLLIEIEFILQIYLQSKSMFANNFAKHL